LGAAEGATGLGAAKFNLAIDRCIDLVLVAATRAPVLMLFFTSRIRATRTASDLRAHRRFLEYR